MRTTTASKRIADDELCAWCDCTGRSPFGCGKCFHQEEPMAEEAGNAGRTVEVTYIERVVVVKEPDPDEDGVRVLARFRVRERPDGLIEQITPLAHHDSGQVLERITPTVVLAIADYLRSQQRIGARLW